MITAVKAIPNVRHIMKVARSPMLIPPRSTIAPGSYSA
jgi:hypothetical protein